jgi:hypothetical protein
VTEFQWLEKILRDEGFIVGPLSRGDERAIDTLLDEAIRERFSNGR